MTKPIPGPITWLGVEEAGSVLIARLRKFLNALDQTFWVVPALIVLGGALLAVALVDLDRSGAVPNRCSTSAWLYNSGGAGAWTSSGLWPRQRLESQARCSDRGISNCCASNSTHHGAETANNIAGNRTSNPSSDLSSEKANGIGA